MSALPRGTCHVCGNVVALRKNGDTREHYVYRPQAEQDPSRPLGRVRTCEGSGYPSVESSGWRAPA